jgi:DNA-binding MarR family transcriptional regulator
VKLEEAIQSSKFNSQKQKAGLNVLYTAWWLKTLISRELKSLGLTHEQYNVLRILKGKHPEYMCVKDIGSRMIERNSNVPRIVDRLELKELVSRQTSLIDKRETVMKLTKEGINILEIASTSIDNFFANKVDLSEEDALQLNMVLERMREKQ